MTYQIYNPTVTSSVIIDPYDDPAGLTYSSNPSIEYFGGKYWAIFDGTGEGLYENSTGQHIWLTTSTDGETWTTAIKPFRDSTYCNNPIAAGGLDMQPNLIVVDGQLWCLWNGVTPASSYISKLSSPTGKWQNFRFEFDGLQPYMSSTVTGSATAGRSLLATFDGISDWLPFMSQNPIQLSNGVVACPSALVSYATDSTQTTTTNAFYGAVKRNCVLKTANGTTWDIALIDTSQFGDFVAWEPFVVENPVGHVYVYTRSLNPMAQDEDYLLVAVSTDGAESFTPSVSTKMLVPSTRGFARRITDSRWVMTHCDHPAISPLNVNGSTSNYRVNGSLFISRRGSNDFIPGVNFSGEDQNVNYPQFTVGPDNKLRIVYTSGVASGQSNRRTLKQVTVNPLPSENHAYIHPRSINTYNPPTVTTPLLRSGSPSHLYFNTKSLTTSTTEVIAATGVSYAAWVSHNGGLTIIDSRQFDNTTPGHVLQWTAFVASGISFIPDAWVLQQAKPTFIAASVSSAGAVNLWYNDGGNSLNQYTGYYKSFFFDDQPSDGDTITADGTTFTFRTTATLTNDIAIGAAVDNTAANTTTKLQTAVTAVRASVNRILVARTDRASISISSTASNVEAESTVPTSGGPALFGKAVSFSSLTPLAGRIYDARVYASALTAANITSLYNSKAASFGYSTVGGTSTAPASPLIHLDANDLDLTEFPELTNSEDPVTAYCDVVSSSVLRIYGEASAAAELPHGATQISIRYKIGAAATGTDRYVIASCGTVDYPVRLYIDAANPTSLYCNGRLVAAVPNPTSYTTLTMIVSTNKVTIESFEQYFSGKPRLFLGNAFPENLLTPAKYVDFNVSEMSESRA